MNFKKNVVYYNKIEFKDMELLEYNQNIKMELNSIE